MKWQSIALTLFFLPIFVPSLHSPFPRSYAPPADSLEPVQKESLTTYEKSFKPSEYDSSIQLLHQKESVINPLMRIPLDSFSIAQPDTVQGFRIQVFSTDNYDEAALTRDNLNVELPDLWVYMIYDAPAYKIRVGDYLNRADANLAVDFFVEKGFKDAWVVPDRVIKNPLPKPPFSSTDSTGTIQK